MEILGHLFGSRSSLAVSMVVLAHVITTAISVQDNNQWTNIDALFAHALVLRKESSSHSRV